MAPKHHPTPLSGGDRKALKKELGKARAMAVGRNAGQGRGHAAAGRQAVLRKLERADVGRRRADRPIADNRPSHQRRLFLAGDPVLPLQDAERRRSRGDGSIRRPPSCTTSPAPALPQMRQSRPTSRGDLAALGLAAAPSPNRSLSDVQFVLDHQPARRPSSRCFAS
jgi:hypothetical protein